MENARKVILITSDLFREIRGAWAFELFFFALLLSVILWLTKRWWRPKLQKLIGDKSLARREWPYYLLIGLFALTLYISYAALHGWPVPRVHDENCYLLMGKTFAAGRVTNQPHSLWPFFEHFHLINQPTFTAKYPPAQGAVLALGIILFNEPIVGVWISGILALLAAFWMLRAFLAPPWSVYGTLLVLTNPTIFEWNQNYWGGNVAIIGGALCVGSLFRLIKDNKDTKIALSLIFALGIALLANSRPFEGVLVCVVLGAVIVYFLIKNFHESGFISRLALKFGVPVILVLIVNFTWMGYYNWRVTGDPLKMPYVLYTSQYDPVPLFLQFSAPNQTASQRHIVMETFYENELQNHYLLLQRSIQNGTLPGLMIKRLINSLISFFSATLFLYFGVLVIGLYFLRKNRKYLLFFAAFIFCFFLETIATYNQSHYYSPFVPFLIVFVTETLASAVRNIRSDAGRVLTVSYSIALIFTQLGWIFVRPRVIESKLPSSINSQFNFQRALSNLEGRHLVLVDFSTGDLRSTNGRYNSLTVSSWIYNEPDIDRSKVVWANDMGRTNNQQLFDYFQDRHIWILGFDQENNGRLVSCEDIDSQFPPSSELEALLKTRCPAGG